MTTRTRRALEVHLKRPHPHQAAFIRSPAKRIIIRSGRRGGKTTGVATRAVERFFAGARVLYATPTQEQIARFWTEVKLALGPLIDAGILVKNETMHYVERPGTEQRIRAKTAWNADTLRGDYADELIFDEWQLMNEDAWEYVGQPMLIDNDGNAIFVYTPPSLHSRSVTKADDPRHAAKMFQAALADPEWDTHHFPSHVNPHLSRSGLDRMASDMTSLAYRMEILAEDIDEAPGALWTRDLLDQTRVANPADMVEIVIGVDPPGGATECGIVAVGRGVDGHVYVMADESLRASPNAWANAVLDLYASLQADSVIGESNYGGDMVAHTLDTAAVERNMQVRYHNANATRGKAIRAQPVAALFEQGKAHIVGTLARLEDELTMWVPGLSKASPNRLDAMVWAISPFVHLFQDPGVMVYDERVAISPY